MQHDLRCLFLIHVEKTRENINHEFHGREIIIEEKHLEKRGPFQLWPGFLDRNVAVRVVRVGVRHFLMERGGVGAILTSRLLSLSCMSLLSDHVDQVWHNSPTFKSLGSLGPSKSPFLMSTSQSAIPDRPRVTVAAIAERDGRFLFVEERDQHGNLVINQPAGHLEVGESLLEAVVREALEETAWQVEPESLVGLYVWGKPDRSITYLRVAVAVKLLMPIPDRMLDEGIERVLWLTRNELLERSHQHRSPLVLGCVDDYLQGPRHPLSILKSALPA